MSCNNIDQVCQREHRHSGVKANLPACGIGRELGHAMDSLELKDLYRRVYSAGKESFFTFGTGDISQEVLGEVSWDGLSVLEIGCGTGETAYGMALAGAKVLAIDYAESAIDVARKKYQHPQLQYVVGDLNEVQGTYDVIVMQEVIEHVEDPRATLSRLKGHLDNSGHLIITCPSFVNLRGIVLMTLRLLLTVPVSLTDRHFISPGDMLQWAQQLGYTCTWRTFRYGLSHGDEMLVDLKKRLTNALRDAGLTTSHVDDLLEWLREVRCHETDSVHNGAKALYHLRPETPG